MKLIFTKRGLRKKKQTKQMVKFICTISRFVTQTSCGGLVYRVFNAISVNRDPFWLCGPLIGYLKAKELI